MGIRVTIAKAPAAGIAWQSGTRYPDGSPTRARLACSIWRGGQHVGTWGWGRGVGKSNAGRIELVCATDATLAPAEDAAALDAGLTMVRAEIADAVGAVMYCPDGGFVPAGWQAGKPFVGSSRRYVRYSLDFGPPRRKPAPTAEEIDRQLAEFHAAPALAAKRKPR